MLTVRAWSKVLARSNCILAANTRRRSRPPRRSPRSARNSGRRRADGGRRASASAAAARLRAAEPRPGSSARRGRARRRAAPTANPRRRRRGTRSRDSARTLPPRLHPQICHFTRLFRPRPGAGPATVASIVAKAGGPLAYEAGGKPAKRWCRRSRTSWTARRRSSSSCATFGTRSMASRPTDCRG